MTTTSIQNLTTVIPVNIFNYGIMKFLSFKDKARMDSVSKIARDNLSHYRIFTEFSTQLHAGIIENEDENPFPLAYCCPITPEDWPDPIPKWTISRLEKYSDPLITALGGVTVLINYPNKQLYFPQQSSEYPSIQTREDSTCETVFLNHFTNDGRRATTLLIKPNQSTWISYNQHASGDFCSYSPIAPDFNAKGYYGSMGKPGYDEVPQEIHQLVRGAHPKVTLQRPTIQETETPQVEKETNTTISI